jgi:SAM-dependent methyltransferase
VSEIGLYSDPEIYDILHWPGTGAEFRGVMRAARAYARTRTRGVWTLLEPACGTARLLRLAARQGYRVLGFDLSPEMIAYANSRLPPPATGTRRRHRLLVADMERFTARFGRDSQVDVAFCPINTIRHLDTDAGMLSHFAEIARILKPGGVYLVGISVTMYGMESESEDIWEGARGHTKVKQVISFVPPELGRFEQVYSHLIIARGRQREHRDSHYRLRCYSLEQWRRLIARSSLCTIATVNADGKPVEPSDLGYCIYVLGHRHSI